MNENNLRERKAFLEEVEAPLGKSDYLTVLSLAESRLKRTPGDLDARIVICCVWIEQERFEEAGEMLREMEDILAGLSQIYTRMGDIYLKKGMPESAQAFYRMFASLNPDTPMAREIYARPEVVPERQATDDGAIAESEEVAQVPGDFQTVTLAELYARQGHLRMAEEVLEAILNKGPHHPKAAEMLREVRGRIAAREEPGEKQAQVMLRGIREKLAAQDEPGEKQAPVMLRDIREKLAARDDPGEKSAPVIPGEVGESIAGREKPVEKRTAELLRELQGLREKIASREEPGKKHAPVIAELSRWLNNIGRLSSHAA